MTEKPSSVGSGKNEAEREWKISVASEDKTDVGPLNKDAKNGWERK